MKALNILMSVAVLASLSLASTEGEKLFKEKGCTACHHPEIDTVAPAVKKIADVYKHNKEALKKFLKGKAEPKVDPARFSLMKPQLTDTKHMSDKELEKLIEFILNTRK
ncbi:MAG: c-type cytochrome [Aquificae bacterium]|nr:c-type cytochrome [Aquificota bacterium]